MSFITQADTATFINPTRLQQMIDGNNTIFEDAADSAEATVNDYLCGRYDTDAIFATTGNSRPKNVMRWVTVILVWYLYERIPDSATPEKVKNNYDTTIEFLDDVAAGLKSVKLAAKPDPKDDTKPATKVRYGFEKQRSL